MTTILVQKTFIYISERFQQLFYRLITSYPAWQMQLSCVQMNTLCGGIATILCADEHSVWQVGTRVADSVGKYCGARIIRALKSFGGSHQS